MPPGPRSSRWSSGLAFVSGADGIYLAVDATVDARKTFIRKTYAHLTAAIYGLVLIEFLYFKTLPLDNWVPQLFADVDRQREPVAGRVLDVVAVGKRAPAERRCARKGTGLCDGTGRHGAAAPL